MAENKLDETKPDEKKIYKLLKYIKYGTNIYKAGDNIEIADKDLDEFKSKKIIEVE